LRIARIQIDEFAKPIVALVCDGAYYDVGLLEKRWGWAGRFGPADFHGRVVGARCAGLEALEMRLRAGDRPTEARLLPGDYLPLPPCDPDRAAYLQLAPYDRADPEPTFERRDSRALIGHDQPVALPSDAESPNTEAGVAVVLGDELWRADAREARRAILGYTLLLDWSARADRWREAVRVPDAASQLGPELWVGASMRDLNAELLQGDARRPAGRVDAWRFQPAEALAFVSQHAPLRAGDVVGLGCLLGGRASPAFGEPVALALERGMTLRGWAVRAPEPPDWRC
jgi:hypothetical protein